MVPTRRDMLKRSVALGSVVACGMRGARAAVSPNPPPAPNMRVRSITRRDDTILRLGGLGDGYKTTWAGDGRQFVVVNDGPGWADPPKAFYNTRLWSISGPATQASFQELASYPELNLVTRSEDAPRYYGHGLLSVRGRVFQFLSTLDRATEHPRHWSGTKLIYSDDAGRSWRNQDGSAPVVWEDWNAQSRTHLTFFDEPDQCFSLLSVLQMGCDYRDNRDGYIYVYGLNGSVDGRMNELVLFRVRTEAILDRNAYEFFGGLGNDGAPRWVRDIKDRKPALRYPPGWVNRTNLFPGDLVVESWLPSVVYNAPLGLYMMASAGIGCAADGTEFGKASYLGFWISATPWGPWRQVHEDMAWTPGGNRAARAYAPQIAPGWIAADGKSFWLIWADLDGIRDFGRDEALMTAALDKAKGPEEHSTIEAEFLRRYMPHFSFNTQRVDLRLEG